MHFPSPRNRNRALVVPNGSMRYLNVLLAVAATLCVLAGAARTLNH